MASKKKEETDLTELLKDVAKNWYIMLPCLVVAGIVGVFVSLWIRPVYQVDALLQIESKNSKNSMGMMGGLGALFSNASPAETEIELIRSRQVMGAAVEKMRLQYEAEPLNFLDRLLHREGRLDLAQIEVPWDSVPKTDKIKEWEVEIKDSTGRFDLYDHLDKVVLSGEPGHTYKFPYAGDSAAFGIISCDVRPGQRFVVRKRKRLDAISSFRSAFDVKEKGKKTGILEFTYQDIYPDRGMAVLNEVASSYLRQNVEERNAEAQKTLEFLEKQLPDVKAQMDSSLMNLNAYRNRVGSVDVNAETQLVLQRRMKLQQDILALQQRKQEAIRLFHSEHPTVKTLEDQEDALKRELAGTASQVKKLPTTQQEVLKLTNEVEQSKILYTTMLNNIQQLRLVSAGEVGSVRIVDFAEKALRPTKPKPKLIVAVALFLGFLFGTLIISLKTKFSSGVKSASFIEKETGFTVYAKVPKGNPQGTKGTRPLAVVEPDDVAVESLRALRSSLEFSMMDDNGSVIGVSGLIPGVGKSFISVNLAALFAGLGKKVLLIDADLRKGRLHKEFGIKRGNGLSQVLLREVQVEEVIHPTEVENMFVIPCGNVPANPAELLGSRHYSDLIERFKSEYDLVIVDTPPIMLVTDAALACRLAAQIVMVIEYNRHSIEAIQEGMGQILKGNSTAHASIVINKYEHSRTEGYGYKYGKY
ncbi:tyrosine-protein kinase Etk/Wzc [Fibrobacter sp. UWH9]|uniref:polysaccharide biosynthesis tyrosine autokinase n=1 Tax=unclassified Fibrobacter TaxID=2634177 RepID=UPI000922C9B0|nr:MULTISPECIES: polysaccharide biosynthesis tyrosine autokinase [Fibrobacter]MCL4100634.1 Tyrosine-protein kinase ptk [Fibrobacter succinogenes]SHG30192.1 tyrosine-protein kinase Etk/Wzc [Fibrobacter sp. UWH9]